MNIITGKIPYFIQTSFVFTRCPFPAPGTPLLIGHHVTWSHHFSRLVRSVTASQIFLKDCSGEIKEEPRYIWVFAAKSQVVRASKHDYYWNKTKYLVNELSTFLCVGRCKRLGVLKSFLWYAPQLFRLSILESPWGTQLGGSCNGWELEGHNILCLLIWQGTFFIRRKKEFFQVDEDIEMHRGWNICWYLE